MDKLFFLGEATKIIIKNVGLNKYINTMTKLRAVYYGYHLIEPGNVL